MRGSVAARLATSSAVPSSDPSSTTMCSHASKLCRWTESIASQSSLSRFLVGVMTATSGFIVGVDARRKLFRCGQLGLHPRSQLGREVGSEVLSEFLDGRHQIPRLAVSQRFMDVNADNLPGSLMSIG